MVDILDKLERLEREATPGPWKHGSGLSVFAPAHTIYAGSRVIAHTDRDDVAVEFDLIPALRNNAKALIAVARAAGDLQDALGAQVDYTKARGEHPEGSPNLYILAKRKLATLRDALAELEKPNA